MSSEELDFSYLDRFTVPPDKLREQKLELLQLHLNGDCGDLCAFCAQDDECPYCKEGG